MQRPAALFWALNAIHYMRCYLCASKYSSDNVHILIPTWRPLLTVNVDRHVVEHLGVANSVGQSTRVVARVGVGRVTHEQRGLAQVTVAVLGRSAGNVELLVVSVPGGKKFLLETFFSKFYTTISISAVLERRRKSYKDTDGEFFRRTVGETGRSENKKNWIFFQNVFFSAQHFFIQLFLQFTYILTTVQRKHMFKLVTKMRLDPSN